jgi:hypothetical protein
MSWRQCRRRSFAPPGCALSLPEAHRQPHPWPMRISSPTSFRAGSGISSRPPLTGRLSHVARIVIPRTSDPDYKCFLYLREFVRRGVLGALTADAPLRCVAVERRGRA